MWDERVVYIKSKRKKFNDQINWINEFENRKEHVEDLFKIIRETSTGKAVANLSIMLFKALEENTGEDLKWYIRFANARKGFTISELLGLRIRDNQLEWYGKSVTSTNQLKLRDFLGSFVRLRHEALNELWDRFDKRYRRVSVGPIGIGLTFGYSAAVKRILQGLCRRRKGLRMILISSETPGAEEIFRAELMGTDCSFGSVRIDIMPFEVIEKREIQRNINSIFIGFESINKKGDIVHPRGGSEIVRRIKQYDKDIKVYAFGESYKVQDFTEDDINFTKLSLLPHEYIDYVVTDHAVHEVTDNLNLACCIDHWESRIKTVTPQVNP